MCVGVCGGGRGKVVAVAGRRERRRGCTGTGASPPRQRISTATARERALTLSRKSAAQKQGRAGGDRPAQHHVLEPFPSDSSPSPPPISDCAGSLDRGDHRPPARRLRAARLRHHAAARTGHARPRLGDHLRRAQLPARPGRAVWTREARAAHAVHRRTGTVLPLAPVAPVGLTRPTPEVPLSGSDQSASVGADLERASRHLGTPPVHSSVHPSSSSERVCASGVFTQAAWERGRAL